MNGTPQAWTPLQLENLARWKLHKAIRHGYVEAAVTAARELHRLLVQHGRLCQRREGR